MSVRTIEQKMSAATPWSGLAPSGGLVRAIVHDVADEVVAATKTWTFVNGAFTQDDVGRLLLMGGTLSGNDGIFTIAQVNSPTEIESVEAPGADETAGATPWTQDIYEASAEATRANDMESYPEGVTGGLFDFENENPIFVAQIMIKFGSGTTSWSLVLVDVDAVEIEVAAASSAVPFVANSGDSLPGGLILLQGQKLKLVSVGGPTTASRARISVDQLR